MLVAGQKHTDLDSARDQYDGSDLKLCVTNISSW